MFREFGESMKFAPPDWQQRWLVQTYPDARLFLDLKHATSRAREMKWLGNYRYALVHMGGRDAADLLARFADTCEHLDFTGQSAPITPSKWQVLRRSF